MHVLDTSAPTRDEVADQILTLGAGRWRMRSGPACSNTRRSPEAGPRPPCAIASLRRQPRVALSSRFPTAAWLGAGDCLTPVGATASSWLLSRGWGRAGRSPIDQPLPRQCLCQGAALHGLVLLGCVGGTPPFRLVRRVDSTVAWGDLGHSSLPRRAQPDRKRRVAPERRSQSLGPSIASLRIVPSSCSG